MSKDKAQTDGPVYPELEQFGSSLLRWDVENLMVSVEWVSNKPHAGRCDLDLTAQFFDERARYKDEVSAMIKKNSLDFSCHLLSDLPQPAGSATSVEAIKIDLTMIDQNTNAILIYLDGGASGPRNFSMVQSVNVKCDKMPSLKESNSMVPVGEDMVPSPLFGCNVKVRKDFQGIALLILYRDGWHNKEEIMENCDPGMLPELQKRLAKVENIPKWVMKVVTDPVLITSKKGIDDKCAGLVVNHVPSLEKFRPRLFDSVKDICNALSSTALPRLKKKFQKSAAGLEIIPFTEVLFKQLFESFPGIAVGDEAAFTVAMIQEMFHQIDYNGDGTSDWDEFTTFCIQNGTTSNSKDEEKNSNSNLDEYIIEYAESMLRRDKVLSMHRHIGLMRYVPQLRRFLVIPEDSDNIFFFDESFKVRSQLYPSKVQILGDIESRNNQNSFGHNKIFIYDIIFLPGRDMFAFTSSDHAIVICKDQTTMGGKKTTYLQHNKFYHSLLHLKLCWSQKHNILCSVASDKTIYGWDIDKQNPLFQVSRHSDVITDFICCDNLDIFITCSMDRRIVMWNATTRRVKGILLGHKRGVRSLCAHENLLLSAGFESDAFTWDMVSKDQVGILRGHRQPIVCAKLMCNRAQSEKDYRAITVDESGEFRLWNIYIKEKSSDPVLLPTLQIFEMNHPENPLNDIRFFEVVNNPDFSNSYYSDLVACSTKLLHFIPEKNTKEFMAPSVFVFNEPASCFFTLNGPNLLKYDICSGEFVCSFQTLHTSDLTYIKIDGERGRRCFIGCQNGDLLIVNCSSGQVIDVSKPHTKEITCIVSSQGTRNNAYTCSLDGKIKLIEESGGKLHVNNSLENAFGEGIGVALLRNVPTMKTLAAVSTTKKWGLWNNSSLKKMVIFEEHSNVASIEVLGTSKDERFKGAGTFAAKDLTITFAVALTDCMKIYTYDTFGMRGVVSFLISYQNPFSKTVDISCTMQVNFPLNDSVNYSKVKSQMPDGLGKQLFATSDDGLLLSWNLKDICDRSEEKFKSTFCPGFVQPNYDPTQIFDPKEYLGKADAPISPVTGASALKLPVIFSDNDSQSTWTDTKITKEGALVVEGTKDDDASTIASKGSARNLELQLPAAAVSSIDVTLPPVSAPQSPSNRSKTPTNKPRTPNLFLTGLGAGESMGSSRNLTECRSTFFIVPTTGIEVLKVNRAWPGHNEAISSIVSMEDHGCIATLSHDGYHRIWNADVDCLGQLALPNLSEKMKRVKPKVLISGWKFVLERIPATKQQLELARIYTDMLLQQKNDKNSHNLPVEKHERRQAVLKFMDKKLLNDFADTNYSSSLISLDESDEHFKFRKSLVLSINEPIVLADDAAPTKVLSKEERRLAQLASNLEQKAILGSVALENSVSISGTQTLSKPTTAMSTKSKSTSLLDRWNTAEDLLDIAGEGRYKVCAAFSEASLAYSMREGWIDGDGYQSLLRVGNRQDKIDAYERSQPIVVLRNPKLSLSFDMPPADSVRRAEVEFGTQKDMYKNAERVLNAKNNLNTYKMRDAIALSRIEQKADSIKSMMVQISQIGGSSLDSNLVQGDGRANDFESETDKLRTDDQKMKLRLLQSAALVPPEAAAKARPLDPAFIASRLDKLNQAVSNGPEWEARFKEITGKGQQKKVRVGLSQAAKDVLEKKLGNAMKDEFKARSLSIANSQDRELIKKSLTTRLLLPYYRLHDVKHFMDIFAKVDEDFSGDLDMEEWCNLFSSLNQNVSNQDARMIFMKIDSNGDGFLSMADLIPVVFGKATKDQQKLILAYAETEIIRKHSGATTVTFVELEQLFVTYDINNVGFVDVSLIRERIRAMQLPEPVQFSFMDSILEIADDDMLSLVEFTRIFKLFVSKAIEQKERK